MRVYICSSRERKIHCRGGFDKLLITLVELCNILPAFDAAWGNLRDDSSRSEVPLLYLESIGSSTFLIYRWERFYLRAERRYTSFQEFFEKISWYQFFLFTRLSKKKDALGEIFRLDAHAREWINATKRCGRESKKPRKETKRKGAGRNRSWVRKKARKSKIGTS